MCRLPGATFGCQRERLAVLERSRSLLAKHVTGVKGDGVRRRPE
jgi:hypothetical protein